MLEFLEANWKWLAVIAAGLVELIVILITKKRPQVVDNSFLIHLCYWIDVAERRFKIGSDKMTYVLDEAKKYLGDKFSEKDVRAVVEYVLTLPEKKEK